MAKFSVGYLNKLKTEWSAIKKMDPTNPHYERMKSIVKNMSDEQQKQIAEANIPWISSFANLCQIKKKNMEVSAVSNEDILELASSGAEIRRDSITAVPATIIFANTVENMRNGDFYAINDVSHLVKRLSYSDLTPDEIASRLTDTFRDVLVD